MRTPDWHAMFMPTVALGEVVLRATIMYLFLFVALRFLLKREGGAISIADLLVVVALVDGAAPAFNGDAQSITESMAFVPTVIGWSYPFNWASWRFERLKFLTAGPPVPLIRDGRAIRANICRAFLTHAELMQQLREQGLDDVRDVRRTFLEGDGEISVIPFDHAR